MRKNDKIYTSNNELVEDLFRMNYFYFITKKFKINDNDKDDLISIIMLKLLEMNTEKLLDLYERDKLLGYIVNMCRLQCYSKCDSTPFYREIMKFNQNSVEFNINLIENNDIDDNEE